MKAVVFTLGCKVNECESDSLIAGLKNMGYDVSDKLEPADVYIVNTCAVTAEAEKKSRQTAARIIKLNPEAKIIYTGCAAQKNAAPFIEKANVTLVTGSFFKNRILEMLDEKGVIKAEQEKEFEELLPVKSLRTRTFVKVQDGCDNFCSYCIIPYLRGRSRSRAPEKVLEEINSLTPLETVVNGINLSAYDYNGITLTGLTERLKDVKTRIRFGSLEANVIDDGFLTACKGLKDFAPHFHLSLQSGSDNVLKKMNRRYTAEEYAEKADLIRKYFPDAGITTDIIAGFPTETEDDFNDTLKLVDRVKFSDIHPFAFSPRSGTPAYKMPDICGEIKKARLDKLLERKATLKKEFADKQFGKTAVVLLEEEKDGYIQGYTGNYLRVYLRGILPANRMQKVIIGKPYRDGAFAEIIK